MKLTACGKVIGTAWVLLALLFLVFAADTSEWAQNLPEAASRILAPPAEGLCAVANKLGIAGARERAAQAVYAVYDRPVLLGAIPLKLAEAATPASGAPAAEQPEVALQAGSDAARYQPKHILIVGASSIQSGLGTEIERELRKYSGFDLLREGRFSSGLARPDYYNWPQRLAELLADFKPDLVIAQWGGNDCQSLTDDQGKFVAKFGTAEWDAEYGRRVAAMVELMRGAGAHAVIIGDPNMRQKSFANKIERLNGVTQAAAEAAGAYYIPLWDLTSGQDGKYLSSIELDGKQVMLRAGDGIHFSTKGAVYAAGKVRERLEARFIFVAASGK